jgi:hypothetical protein
MHVVPRLTCSAVSVLVLRWCVRCGAMGWVALTDAVEPLRVECVEFMSGGVDIENACFVLDNAPQLLGTTHKA